MALIRFYKWRTTDELGITRLTRYRVPSPERAAAKVPPQTAVNAVVKRVAQPEAQPKRAA